ncbi:MAG: zinc-binding dehydrogenase [Planctomycetota bacterium]
MPEFAPPILRSCGATWDFQGVLGHEFVGVVQESPDATWIGARVVGSINIANPERSLARRSDVQHAPDRTVLGILGHDGAMADRVCLPIQNLYRVPDSVTDHHAVFTEPLAAALRIADQVAVGPSDRIAVVGPGRLGMLIGRVLSLAGASVVMVGRSDRSLELARRWRLPSLLTKEAKPDSFDLVVEATGNEEGLKLALDIVRPLGRLVMKSTYAKNPKVDLTKIVVGEITVVGSRCGPFAPALRLLQTGQVDVTALIDAEYPIEKALEAFEHAAKRGVRKIILRMT